MGLCETTNLNWVGSPTLKYSLPFDVEQKPTQCQQAYRSQKKTTLSMDTNLKVAHKTQVSPLEETKFCATPNCLVMD